MELSAGQREVCVDTKPGKDTGAPVLLAYLREGSSYTVRSLEAFPGQDAFPTLRLEEVICPTIKTSQMRHAQVCLGEIPLRLKMRKAHSTDVMELETHQPDASAANRALELLGMRIEPVRREEGSRQARRL